MKTRKTFAPMFALLAAFGLTLVMAPSAKGLSVSPDHAYILELDSGVSECAESIVLAPSSMSRALADCDEEVYRAMFDAAACAASLTAFGAAMRGWRMARALAKALRTKRKNVARALGLAAAGACGYAYFSVREAWVCKQLAADSECPGECMRVEESDLAEMMDDIDDINDSIEDMMDELDEDEEN